MLQGIRCSFKSLLAVRQAHGFAFGKSDLFMLCALYADTANQELVPQASPASRGLLPVSYWCRTGINTSSQQPQTLLHIVILNMVGLSSFADLP